MNSPVTPASQKEHAPNYLAAFLLTLFLGLIGTNRLYTGHWLIGWLRCLLFMSVFIAPAFYLIDATAGTIALIIGATANAAASLWWYIDLWLYYLGDVHDRRSGLPLDRSNPRDRSFAKSMMISLHLAIVVLVVAVAAGIGLLISSLQQSPLLKGLSPNGGSVQLDQLLKQYGQ